jgi:DNA polymerase-3 subunit delta'
MMAAGADTDGNEALATLAAGSVGTAIRLSNLNGLQTYANIVSLFATLPRMDRMQALKLAECAGGRGAEPRLELILDLMDFFLSRLARTGVAGISGPEAAAGELELLSRLSPDHAAGRHWAVLHQTLGARARHGRSVNLDPATLLLDMILKIDEAAGQIATRCESGS